MSALPTGTVTLLFSDIVGSTALWEQDPAAMARAIEGHNRVALAVVQEHQGRVFKFVGDRVCAVFGRADQAIACSLALREAIEEVKGPGGVRLQIRQGLFSGAPECDGTDYYGPPVNRVARLCDLGHTGQILAAAVVLLLAGEGNGRWEGTSLGSLVLRGMALPQEVVQIDRFGETAQFPPLALVEDHHEPPAVHNLPAETVKVIGREREAAHVMDLLVNQQARLVTILGIGGLGKTTLARHVARQCLEAFQSQVRYVDCETVREAHELESAVRTAISPEGDGSDQTSWNQIGNRKMLLVLDCLEQAAAQGNYVRHLLERCHSLQILCTSRVVLGLDLEHEVALEGLGTKSQAAAWSPAEQLFIESAQRSGVSVGRRQAGKVRQLVRDLEAVPLAIVLAAGRLRHLSLDQVCQHVHQNRIALLSAPRHAQGKHASMTKVIESSFDLLEAEDFELALQASVFEGGFGLEDALAVFRSSDVLDGIARLRDHSLLQASVREGTMRYRALDSVREYIAMMATSAGLHSAKEAHLRYFVGRAESLRARIGRSEWAEASRTMRLELGNFRAALRWARDQGDAAAASQKSLTISLARCFLEGGLSEDFRAVASSVEAVQLAVDPALGIELSGLWGTYHRRRGEFGDAKASWERRLELANSIGDVVGECDTLLDLADLALTRGAITESQEAYDRFRSLSPQLRNAALVASGLLVGAKIDLANGGHPLALVLEAEALANNLRQEAFSLYVWRTLSELWRELGEFDRALANSRRLLRAALEGDHAHYAGRALVEMAVTARAAGDDVQAGKLLAVASVIPRHASPRLRQQLIDEKKHLRMEGLEAFEGSKSSGSGTDWTSLALTWVTEVTSPA